jgi:predicted RNase H-like nuclease (RuvC/YqgF family)
MGCCKHGNTDGECLRCEEEFLDEVEAENAVLRKEVEALRKELATSQESERRMSVYSVTLRKELAEANSFIESLANACQAAEARAIEAEAEAAAIKTNIVRKHKSARMSDPRPGLYLCSRSSEIGGGKPCDEAFKVVLVQTAIAQTEKWAVEVTDLQAFSDKHGACVIGRNSDGFCTIEIYDTYRE